jgi:hypothetical protein
MLQIEHGIEPAHLKHQIENLWQLSGDKILDIEEKYNSSKGSPVFTKEGKYTSRGWTEWTQGFVYGSAILQFDATRDPQFLDIGRKNTIQNMASHVSHMGVHDHGFNNVSTYGNLLRLYNEGVLGENIWEKQYYELALKISGAVQASRWTVLPEGGFIYSFNGPHSLFVDTIRSCRVLMLAHKLGHDLQAENDIRISLFQRAIQHIIATARYSVYFGNGRDLYDIKGRTAHESIFNINDGRYRCPNSQQGYSGFTTWTRGLAWAICGFAEQLEFLKDVESYEFNDCGGKEKVINEIVAAARATSDYYIELCPTDGVPYWDTGAPNLYKLGDYQKQKSDPFNAFEPIDSSAAAIACQGLMRLGKYLIQNNQITLGTNYFEAGLSVLKSLLSEPYLSSDSGHQGLLLHSVYHRPNDWDHKPKNGPVPFGESSQWGDYHLREAAIYVKRLYENQKYYTFF